MRDQLVLADLGPIETRLLRARKDPAARQEVPALEAAMEHLSGGAFLAERAWDRAELKVFSPLAPVTLKPVVVVWNVDEDGLGAEPPDSGGLPSFVASAALEAEVADLPPEEAAPLLEAYGVSEPALGRVIAAVYGSLDLITFFTTGDDETRAWEVGRGALAPEAAGVIHSDIQRGFIRAEVVGYDELVALGSWDKAKAAGQLRVEGKDYVMAEGDVVHFRFNV
jgi:ribosome-binding ATPase YchF (GTP1/OBG family)